ncbi:MAG: hypothetical protein H7Z74_09900 [Anaerolineae bacterium]|nr:hypothetical protein [Gemmatimonadaceae bacterium]
MSGRHLPADHSRGDEATLGGYMAVHDRPAAFEGKDTLSYSVSIECEPTGKHDAPWGGYILFIRWGHGEPKVTGHLETEFIAYGASEAEARSIVGALPLIEVKVLLDALIRDKAPAPGLPWWEAMNSER